MTNSSSDKYTDPELRVSRAFCLFSFLKSDVPVQDRIKEEIQASDKGRPRSVLRFSF